MIKEMIICDQCGAIKELKDSYMLHLKWIIESNTMVELSTPKIYDFHFCDAECAEKKWKEASPFRPVYS
jgi:Fe2+ or Zn2+ uptake regulation protein